MTTPTKNLDAATIKRCAQVILDYKGEEPGKTELLKYHNLLCDNLAAAIRALAKPTDPNLQYPGKDPTSHEHFFINGICSHCGRTAAEVGET